MPASRNIFIQKLSAQAALTAAGIGLLAIMAIVVTFIVFQLRTTALEEAKRNIGNLAIVLAEQTARSVQTIDLILRDFQDNLRAAQVDSINSIDDFERLVGTDSIQHELKEKITRL